MTTYLRTAFKHNWLWIITTVFFLSVTNVLEAGKQPGKPTPAGWTDTFSVDYGGVQDGVVHDLAAYNGYLAVGGQFSSVGLEEPVAASNVALFGSRGWFPLGDGVSGQDQVGVYALAVYEDLLIVAGDFDMAGALPVRNIAAWDGANWMPLAEGVGGDALSRVNALYVYEGDLYAGGTFTEAGTEAAQNVARWDGTTWSPVGAGRPGTVYDLTEWDQTLVAGGQFTAAAPTGSIAYFDGYNWHDIGFEAVIRALTTMDYDGQGDVLIAGGQSFPTAGSVPGHLFYYDGDWHEFEGGVGRDGTYTSRVDDMLVYDDKLIITGLFHYVGDPSREIHGIAYWEDGWHAFDEGLGDHGHSLWVREELRDTVLYVGGDIWFTGEYETQNLGQYIFPPEKPGGGPH